MATTIGLQTSVPHPKNQGGKGADQPRSGFQNVTQSTPSAGSKPGASPILFGKQPGGHGGAGTTVGKPIK